MRVFPAHRRATIRDFIMNEPTPKAGFPTTRWSRIAHAGDPDDPEARAAMAELCEAYWYPVYALIRRQGYGAEERST